MEWKKRAICSGRFTELLFIAVVVNYLTHSIPCAEVESLCGYSVSHFEYLGTIPADAKRKLIWRFGADTSARGALVSPLAMRDLLGSSISVQMSLTAVT